MLHRADVLRLAPLFIVAALVVQWGCSSGASQGKGANHAPAVVNIESSFEGAASQGLLDETPTTAVVDTPPKPAKTAPGTLAQSSASDRATARALASSGLSKLNSKDAAGALKDFRAADALVNVPTTRLFVAKAQLQLGHKANARQTLESVGRMPSGPHEPAAFVRAREEAKRLLRTLRP